MKSKTIAILTSGGDAPGMNAVIRAITRVAIIKGIKVLGVLRGYEGLINGDIIDMNLRTVSNIINHGGTILYTTRSEKFKTKAGIDKAFNVCKAHGVDCLIVIGGDGSLKGAKCFAEFGIPCIVIPATIDNDINCSEYTIGYDTAMNNAMQMIDKIKDTARSNDDRCNVVEVMGRNCGNIALNTGIAVGATAILVPEIKFDIDKDVIQRIKFTQKMGKKHFLIVVAEGVKNIEYISEYIKSNLKIESRSTVLGHVQRGGSPTLKDRVMATKMGYFAVELFDNYFNNQVVILKDHKISSLSLNDYASIKKEFDLKLYNMSLDVSI